MELDKEVKGDGNSYTTEFRQYDPRLGRWLSLDPLMGMYPNMSPLVAFDNNPIFYVDPLGLESGDKDGKASGDGKSEKIQNS
jgi:RHS repeat-associated protein